jgi:t-SNARE complex subunit (syntaxin)
MMESDNKKNENVSLGVKESCEHVDETVLLSIRSLKQWKIPEDSIVSIIIFFVFVYRNVFGQVSFVDEMNRNKN